MVNEIREWQWLFAKVRESSWNIVWIITSEFSRNKSDLDSFRHFQKELKVFVAKFPFFVEKEILSDPGIQQSEKNSFFMRIDMQHNMQYRTSLNWFKLLRIFSISRILEFLLLVTVQRFEFQEEEHSNRISTSRGIVDWKKPFVFTKTILCVGDGNMKMIWTRLEIIVFFPNCTINLHN